MLGCLFSVLVDELGILMWKNSHIFWDGYGGNIAAVLVFIFPLTALLTWGYLRGKGRK